MAGRAGYGRIIRQTLVHFIYTHLNSLQQSPERGRNELSRTVCSRTGGHTTSWACQLSSRSFASTYVSRGSCEMSCWTHCRKTVSFGNGLLMASTQLLSHIACSSMAAHGCWGRRSCGGPRHHPALNSSSGWHFIDGFGLQNGG